MRSQSAATPPEQAVALVRRFLERVWGPGHDLAAMDQLMTEDCRIWSGGKLIAGREAFKEWVRDFQPMPCTSCPRAGIQIEMRRSIA